MRNGVSDWPVEKQREALAAAGFAGPIYEDTLSRNQMRGRDPKCLVERTVLLRPTGRQAPGVIKVASIRIFALNPVDLIDALAQAAAQQETVIALDTGLEISPNAGAAQFAAAASAWDKGRRNAQTLEGRAKGNQAAAAAKRARSQPGLAIARELWALPTEEISGAEIARQAGLSVGTLYNELGPRGPAQKRRANALERQKAAFEREPKHEQTRKPKT